MAAVNLATAPTSFFNHSAQHQPYIPNNQEYCQPTPHSSASPTPTQTPAATSPTSPRPASTSPNQTHSALYSRQLRPPKAPLYVPAVLRPTEKPAKYNHGSKAPSTSPRSKIGSPNALLTPPSTPGTSFDSEDGAHLTDETMQRRMLGGEDFKAGVTRIVTDEWNGLYMEDVTGTPTRNHWKPDSSSNSCDAPSCRTPFTFLNRRHHCRRCGNIYCSIHSPHSVPLDQHARFHPNGSPGRACDFCWADFAAWKKARRERGSVSTEGSSGSATPVMGRGEEAAEAGSVECKGKKRPDMLVGSVPRDWNWSTF